MDPRGPNRISKVQILYESRKKVGRNGRINGGASHTKVVGIK